MRASRVLFADSVTRPEKLEKSGIWTEIGKQSVFIPVGVWTNAGASQTTTMRAAEIPLITEFSFRRCRCALSCHVQRYGPRRRHGISRNESSVVEE